ncbi:STAS domain-containing protein [Jiella avicenniae]|uniref:STAS domain-containing protein n=1 Tax=Jiella avicenniae TaxID=2907202 RepID=A0A9X1TC16_9HYPH|nr:STAS domain-containing protein [Jiella avicenniae]MCE7028603.1 STAS domain-containing protein [Jiella avicenniae]
MKQAEQVKIVSLPDEIRPFELAGDCNIRNAADIAERLQQRTGDILIDARGLTGVDVAVLQLLVSARKSTAARGCSMRVVAESAGTLRTAVDRAGLGSTFRDVLVPDLP